MAEHFQISVELLRVRLRQHRITVPCVQEPTINVSPKRADEAAAIDGCREVSEFLQSPLMQTNIRLYDHVLRRFEGEVRAELGRELPSSD